MMKLEHKGNILLGTLVSLYGAAGIACGGFVTEHEMMQYACYGLAAVALVIGVYFIALAKEIMGIPVLLTGLLHVGCALLTPHNIMPILCISLGSLSMINGFVMYSIIQTEKKAEN